MRSTRAGRQAGVRDLKLLAPTTHHSPQVVLPSQQNLLVCNLSYLPRQQSLLDCKFWYGTRFFGGLLVGLLVVLPGFPGLYPCIGVLPCFY